MIESAVASLSYGPGYDLKFIKAAGIYIPVRVVADIGKKVGAARQPGRIR